MTGSQRKVPSGRCWDPSGTFPLSFHSLSLRFELLVNPWKSTNSALIRAGAGSCWSQGPLTGWWRVCVRLGTHSRQQQLLQFLTPPS